MNWTYMDVEVTELPDGTVGFVYCITNCISGKKYIGKKLGQFTKTKIRTVTLKNGTKKKKKIREKIDSDWLQYYGSSDALLADIELLGVENFKREILHYCTSKAMCSYLELREQVLNDVLLHPDMWYNGIIQVKIHRNHLKGLNL